MSEIPPAKEPRHPMRLVVQRTGLTADLLRAWEKRYGVVEPGRSAGGQRLYSDADVARLRLLGRAVHAGRAISQVVELPTEQLEALVKDDELAAGTGLPPLTPRANRRMVLGASDASVGDLHLSNALVAVERLDAAALEQTLRAAAVRLPGDQLLDEVIAPLLFTIGSLWHQGQLRPSNEHMATVVIRRVLGWVADLTAPPGPAPVMLLATPAGQHHELGAMLAAATASQHGWRVTYLGPDLPADDIALAARQARADVVALSILYPQDDPRLPDELRRLRRGLAPSVAIVAGGAGIDAYRDVLEEIGAERFAGLAALRRWLHQGAG